MGKVKDTPKTKTFLSTDIDIEYFELLNNLIEEQKLGSRREGLAFVFEGYKRSLKNPSQTTENDSAPSICEYLSDDRTLCCKNKDKIKKTTLTECNACQKAQKALAKNSTWKRLNYMGNY